MLLLASFYVRHYDLSGYGIIPLATIICLAVAAIGLAQRSKKYQTKKESIEYEAEKDWIKENVRAGLSFSEVKKLIEPRFRLRVSDRSFSLKHGKGVCHDFESEYCDLRVLENEGKVVEVKIDANY